jgi:nucleoside phosphorylase
LCKSSKQRQDKNDLLQANELMIAVTFALPTESLAFLRRLGNKTRSHREGIRIIRGQIDDRTIEVLHTGVGEKTCRQRMASFLQDRQFDCLVSAGFAGALNDKLRAGDLLFAENFSTVQLNKMRPGFGSSPIHRANLLTVPSIIDSTEERQKIAQTTGAAAADMETEFIARGCAEHGVPLLSLRVITDTPAEPFPAPAHVLFDIAKQRTQLAKLMAFFLTRPNRVPRLVQFATRITAARKILAKALVAILRQL